MEPTNNEPAILRRPVVFVPPVIPETWSQAFADSVGNIANAPEMVEGIKQRYEATGNSAELKAYEDNFYRATSEEAAVKVTQGFIARAKELGLDETTLVKLDVAEKLSILESEGKAMVEAQKQSLAILHDKALTDPEAAAQNDAFDQTDVDLLTARNQSTYNYAVKNWQQTEGQETDYQKNFRGGATQSAPSTLAEFAFAFGTPFLSATEINAHRMIAEKMGLKYKEDGSLLEWNDKLNPGEIRAGLKQMYLDADPIQRADLWKVFKKSSGSMLSDLSARSLAEFVFNPNAGPPGDDQVDYMMNAVLPWVDTVFSLWGAGALGKWGIQGITRTAGASVKATVAANKLAARTQVAAVIVDAQKALNPVLKSKTYAKNGMSEAQVGISQVPKEATVIDQVVDFPDNLADEVERVRKIQEDLSVNLARQGNLNLTDENISAIIDREAKEIEENFQGTVRPGLSTIKVKSDGSGIEFGTVLGKNDLTGFPSTREAFSKAEEHVLNGERVVVLESDGLNVQPLLTGEEAVDGLLAIQSGKLKDRLGTFYVKVIKDYNYRPTDKLLFGDDPVVAPTWLGRAANYLLHPSNRFTEEFYGGYLKNYLTEQSTKAYLGRIVAPIRAMSNSTQRRINDMYEWSYQFGRQNKKEATVNDLLNHFDYASTSEEIRGFYLMKQFYKTAHEIQNKRLFKDWNARGFKTVRSKDGQGGVYHGAPVARESVRKQVTVFDPELQALRVLDKEALDTLYGEGGQLLKTDMALRGKKRNDFSYNLMVRGGDKAAYEAGPLASNPLREIPGYWPRMYKDAYYIRRAVPNANIDGVSDPNFSQVVAIAGTKKEADAFVEYANRRSKKGPVYSVQDDARLSQNDSIANDLEFLRTEGRLFFDTRKPHLRDVHGVKAETYDPINMLTRATGAISRQVAVEDLVKGLKNAWSVRYGKLIRGDVERTQSSGIALQLNQRLTASGDEQVSKALLSWQYIQVMEGSVNQANQWFRRASIASAEWLGTLLKKTTGATDPANWLIRNGGNLSPVEGLKNFAFHYFITMRPLRQIVVQSSQHLFIAALDPTYGIGRIQKDIPNLMLGLRRKARSQVFSESEETFFSKVNAAMMGYSKKEYDLLVKEFDRSGLIQTIDVHSIAGSSMSSVDDLPLTKLGDIAQTAGKIVTLAPVRNFFRRAGFELGEGANLAASYLMALRLFKKANGIKKLTDIPPAGWEEIGFKASNYSLAMNRAGAANYQYSVLSLPLQFLQYSHKTMLVGAKAVLGKKLASSFTTTEARKIMAGQLLLFGGAGFGVKEYVSGWLGKAGFEDLQGTEIEDIIAGGTLDWTLDNTLQNVSNDPQLDLAFDTLLAPGGSVAQTGRQFWEAAMEQPIYGALTGPSFEAGSQVMKFVSLAKTMRGEGIEDEESLKEGLILAGSALYGGAWANDLWKARLAQKTGYWVSSNGQISGIEAQWQGLVAKGFFGINSQNVIDNYNLLEDQKDYETKLDEIAKGYSDEVNQLSLAFASNQGTYEDYSKRLRQAAAGFKGGLEPEEWMYVVNKFYRYQQGLGSPRANALDMIAESISHGMPADEAMLAKVKSSALLRNHPQREDFLKLLEQSIQEMNEQRTQPIDIFELDQEALKNTDKLLKGNTNAD